MIFPNHDFRRHVARRATGILLIILPPLSRNAHIRNPQIPFFIQHNILGFDIPVYDIIYVHVLEADDDIGYKEFGLWLGEFASTTDMIAQVATV